MKRILSLILCVLMLVPCFALVMSAASTELDEEYKNFATEMGSYASSIWNNDSDPKYINNDVLSDWYRFWRPDSTGRNPAIDDKMQYCGLKSSGQYYLLQELVLYVEIDSPDNNICYTIKALVLGEWVEIGKAYNQDAESIDDEISDNLGKLTIDVDDVVTREIRVECTEWGRWATSNTNNDQDDSTVSGSAWHDWWRVPIIHEVQTMGVESLPPPWDVPDGAVLSTNACLGGMANASSSNTFLNIYPALATDDNILPTTTTPRPYWQAGKMGAGQSVWTEFDRAYDIDNITANFGGSVDGVVMKYDVQVLVNGTWEYIAQGLEATSSIDPQEDTVIATFDSPKNVEGVKFIFTESSSMAVLTEMGAEINPDYKVWDEDRQDYVEANKCVFLRDFMTANRKQSTAIGNLAIFGSAYASSIMSYANISAVSYINDGGIARNEDFSWFAETFEKGTYCGVELKEAYNVDKVVLYFNDPVTGNVSGTNVMAVDIQVKNENGEFVTVKSGVTSYDQTKREYVVSVQFDAPVLTDDVRIVYNSNGMVFPYIKELEVYSSEFYYGAFRGHQIGQRTSGGKAANLLEDFAKKTSTPRSTYLDKISPIQYFDIPTNSSVLRANYLDVVSPIQYFGVTQEHGIKVLAWI